MNEQEDKDCWGFGSFEDYYLTQKAIRTCSGLLILGDGFFYVPVWKFEIIFDIMWLFHYGILQL